MGPVCVIAVRGSDQFQGLFPFKLELLHRTLPRRTAGTRSSADELVRFVETPNYYYEYEYDS